MGDSMRDMYYAIRTVAEIKKMSKQFQLPSSSSSLDQLTFMMGIFTMQSLTDNNTRPKLINDYAAALVLDSTFRNNKNIGLRGQCIVSSNKNMKVCNISSIAVADHSVKFKDGGNRYFQRIFYQK
jgi:hypothetical protein